MYTGFGIAKFRSSLLFVLVALGICIEASANSRVHPTSMNSPVDVKNASLGQRRDSSTRPDGITVPNFFGGVLYAELFPGGIPDAVLACPAAGCVIYAIAPTVNRNLGSIDPANKAITIYLGPYVYNVTRIVLRKSLRLIGMGASDNGTILQSVNGNDPVFVLPQTNNSPATNVLLSGFRLFGSVNNSKEDGFFLDTSSTVNSGMWYSKLGDIYMQGFSGIPMHIRGPNNSFVSMSQWVDFENVVALRNTNGGNGLRMEGANFELRFTNCQFDGQAIGDGTNIYLGGMAGGVGGYPVSIDFEGLISQVAAVAVQIDGGVNLRFHGSHHEKLWGAYQIKSDFDIWTQGVSIVDSYFADDVGVNAGAGFLLNVATTFAGGISFVHNWTGNADSVVKGTNLASVSYQDNYYGGSSDVPPTSRVTTQIEPATTINIHGAHSIGLNPNPTPIATIQSSLGPGEMVTLFSLAGPVTFSTGGNLNLLGKNSVTVNGSITFVRSDLTGNLQWTPVAQWSPLNAPASRIPRER